MGGGWMVSVFDLKLVNRLFLRFLLLLSAKKVAKNSNVFIFYVQDKSTKTSYFFTFELMLSVVNLKCKVSLYFE